MCVDQLFLAQLACWLAALSDREEEPSSAHENLNETFRGL
jgi:hypothetical protein